MAFVFVKKQTKNSHGLRYELKLKKHVGKDGRFALSIYINPRLAKRMRWVLGDRVYFGIDEEVAMCGIKRTSNEDGYKLLATSKKGSSSPLYFRMTMATEVIAKIIGGDERILGEGEIEIDDTMIVFDMLARKAGE